MSKSAAPVLRASAPGKATETATGPFGARDIEMGSRCAAFKGEKRGKGDERRMNGAFGHRSASPGYNGAIESVSLRRPER